MALKEVKLEAFSLKDLQGKCIKGYYLSTRKVQTQFGISDLHEFYSEEKKQYFSIWGVTSLDLKLKLIPVGSYVEFTYFGKEMAKTKYGPREVHKVKVGYDPDRTMVDKRVNEVVEIDDEADIDPFEDLRKGQKESKPAPAATKLDDDDLPF